MIEEIWKDIPDYEGFYQASNLGNIKSLSRRVFNRQGYWVRPEKILKPQFNGAYYHCRISKNNMVDIFMVHRLVALAHLPKIDGKPMVNHKDGNKSNNALFNLEWCSNYENMEHAKDVTKVFVRGEKNSNTKNSDEEIREIRKLYAEGISSRKIAAKYGIVKSSVLNIIHRKTWAHI